MKCITLDIEIHDKKTCPNGEKFVQCKYLVHISDDVLWTNYKADVLSYIAEELNRLDEDY